MSKEFNVDGKKYILDGYQIDALVALGYDLYIYDRDGDYPDSLGREEWEQREIRNIIYGEQNE